MKIPKNILTIFLIGSFLIIGSLSFKSNNTVVIVKGKINGEIPERVDYTMPINGVCDWSFYESLQPDSLGNFQVVISNIDQPTFIKLRIPGKSHGIIILEQGQSYEVDIDLEAQENNFKVSCPSRKGQELYNSLPKTANLQIVARKYVGYSNSSDIIQELSSIKDNEISELRKLLDNGHISKGFFNLIKSDRECYYSAIQGTVALLKYFDDSQKNKGIFTDEVERMWGAVFHNNAIMNPDLIRSTWYYSLVKNYLNYKEYTSKSFNKEEMMKIYKQGLIHTHNIDEAKKHLAIGMLEYYDAKYIYDACLQKRYENELITLFDQFKKSYPDSEYSKYLVPMLSPIVEYHKAAEQPLNDQIKFVENFENINSLEEGIKILRGKKVYVDVWATWCGPCKVEFGHRVELKKLLESNGIEILYVSIDKDERDKQWKDMIKYYNLEGYHIRANEKFDKDLRSIYGQGGMIEVPWYILIDEFGSIVKRNAKRPSQLRELEDDLNKI